MNPCPAEKPSLVENLQQVSRRTRRDEVRELCRQAAAEISRLAGELARVEKERDATRAVVAAYLEWVNSECASELDGATATHAKLVFGPSMKSYPTPTLPAKEQR